MAYTERIKEVIAGLEAERVELQKKITNIEFDIRQRNTVIEQLQWKIGELGVICDRLALSTVEKNRTPHKVPDGAVVPQLDGIAKTKTKKPPSTAKVILSVLANWPQLSARELRKHVHAVMGDDISDNTINSAVNNLLIRAQIRRTARGVYARRRK